MEPVKSMDFYSALHKKNNTIGQEASALKDSNFSKPHPTADRENSLSSQEQINSLMQQNAKLHKLNTTLQVHNCNLRDTVNELNKANTAMQERHRENTQLQTQLHADYLRKNEVKESTLTERCKSMAAFAEQHRLASAKHEQKHKNLAKELQNMAAVQVATEGRHQTAMEEVKRLQSMLESKTRDAKSLQDNLHSLQSDLQTLKQTNRTVSGRLQKAIGLLQDSPHQSKTLQSLESRLESSAEVMELAHARGSTDSMRECLGQVGSVLKDLHGQLQGHHRLASAWQERVRVLLG